jgi:hypothetical protein
VKNQIYYTGEEIHVGDRVTFAGCPATILLVLDRDEFPAAESEASRDWWRVEHGTGFLLNQDGGANIFMDEADEDLILVSRSGASPPDAAQSPQPGGPANGDQPLSWDSKSTPAAAGSRR